jgi:hypothetical protein
MGLLDGDIATIANDALGGILLDVSVAPKVVTNTAPGKFADSWPVAHGGKGFVEDYSDFARASGIPATDRKVVLLAKSLLASGAELTPKRGDRVTAEGRTYDVIEVGRDPAGATWELQAR